MVQSVASIRPRRFEPLRDLSHRPGVLRAPLVAGTLVASAALARSPSPVVLGGLAGLIGLLVCWRWPGVALASLVLGALIIPFQIATGTQTSINAAVIMTALFAGLWLFEMLIRRDVRLLPSRAVAPTLVFGLVCVVAFVAGLQVWQPFATTAPLPTQLGGLAAYLLSLAAFLLTAHRIRELGWLQALTWLYLAWAAVYMVRRTGLVSDLPISVPVGADYSVFWTWVAALSFSQAAFNTRLARGWRAALFLLTAATVFAGLRLVTWNSGWVPPLVALSVILWLGAPRLALVFTIVGLLGVLLKIDALSGILFGAKNQYDLLTRTAAWSILFDIIRLDPILGIGFGNYYWYMPLYFILGFPVSFNSHNNYIDLLAQTGLLGLASFGWLMWAITRIGWRLRRRAPVGFARAYVYGALGGLAGMLVSGLLGDWVLPFVYNIGLVGFRSSVHGWLFLGGLIAIEQIVLRDSVGLELAHPDAK